MELLTEDNRYRWLNTSFLVGEGEIDEETDEWWIETYVCVNDVAGDPPAIGQPPRSGSGDGDAGHGGLRRRRSSARFGALRDRHGRPEPRVERRTFTTSSAGGSYRAALQVLLVGEHRYLDTGWRSPDAA